MNVLIKAVVPDDLSQTTRTQMDFDLDSFVLQDIDGWSDDPLG
jgi:hypothetical protein